MRPPFVLRAVCWPQPVAITAGSWTPAPAWDAPVMETLPRWELQLSGETLYWSIDWRDHFRAGAKRWNPHDGGEMRGFQVVFRLKMQQSGTLAFGQNDGCIVRRGGAVLHESLSSGTAGPESVHRKAKAGKLHELKVDRGDLLEIAQTLLGGTWRWSARLQPETARAEDGPRSLFRGYLGEVDALLRRPARKKGPALKMYTDGKRPFRAATGIYSMVLNGYTPAEILLYGEEQWPERSREIFSALLPFARTVPLDEATAHLRHYGGDVLEREARRRWFVMKTGVALFMPPAESCLIDDDVLILDAVSDALHAFSRSDLVYGQDQDLGEGYLRHWGKLFGYPGALRHPSSRKSGAGREPQFNPSSRKSASAQGTGLATAHFNAGLYWIRNIPNPHRLAALALRCRARKPIYWEQGLIALAYARRRTWPLPSQRYNFVVFDGLPGGVHGYDYARNPCGFAAIHYGNLAEKPSDAFALQVLEDVLERRRNPAMAGSRRSKGRETG